MFKTLVKSWPYQSSSKWGAMATITGALHDYPPSRYGYQPPGHVRLYSGFVEILHEASYNGVITNLTAWVNIHERNVKGYSGYAPPPLGLPENPGSEDDRVVNLQNVASYHRLRFYIELLKATTVLDGPLRNESNPRGFSWLSGNTAFLGWADWHLLSRYAIPVRGIPMEVDLLSENNNERNGLRYFPFVQGDIFGVRLLVDQSQENYHFSCGDAITVMGSIIDEEGLR